LSAEVSEVNCSVPFGFKRSENKSPPPMLGIMCSGGSEVQPRQPRRCSHRREQDSGKLPGGAE
jgi:hypothetical protein